MLRAKSIPNTSSGLFIPTVRGHLEASVTGKSSSKSTHIVPFYRVPQKQRGLVKAAKQVNVNIQENEPVSSSSSSSSTSLSRGDGIDVKAVITIRKKMKEKLNEKIEDQWESFIIGIGQGILIQLISQDIDPGLFSNVVLVFMLD